MKDHIEGRVHVCGLPGKNLSPGCTKKSQASRGSGVMLWEMFCWEVLSAPMHMIVADCVLSFMTVATAG